MKIFVDLDEVFSDFRGSACRVHGVDPKECDNILVDLAQWDIIYALRVLKNNQLFNHEDFWRPIHAEGVSFWENLDPLPWANDLRQFLDDTGYPWYILTAPCRGHEVYEGKLKWMWKFFGEDFRNFIITPHKYLFAGPDRLLVDDSETNIERWVEHPDSWPGKLTLSGGIGHLFATNPCVAEDHARQQPFEHFVSSFNNLMSSRGKI